MQFFRFVTLFLFLTVLTVFNNPAQANPLKNRFEEATSSFQNGEYEKAAKIYEGIIRDAPTFGAAYNALGLLYRVSQMKAPNEVAWYFEKAVEFDPDNVQAYDHLCKLYYAVGDFDKAENNCMKALEINPDIEGVKEALAWNYLLGTLETEKAEDLFRQVSLEKKDAMAYYGLGWALLLKEDMMSTMDIITSLRQMDREDLALRLEDLSRKDPEFIIQTGRQAFGIRAKNEINPNLSHEPVYKNAKNVQVRLSGNLNLP